MKINFLLVLMAMASVFTRAQQPVSLKDTLKWMHDFVTENSSQYTGQSSIDNHTCKLGEPKCQQRHDVSTFEAQGCSATITWSVTLNDRHFETHAYLVSLKELDPNTVSWVKVGSFENAVEADTTNQKQIVETLSLPIGRTQKYEKAQGHIELSRVDVLFDSGAHAKRFVEVFEHAIRLCGGKPSRPPIYKYNSKPR